MNNILDEQEVKIHLNEASRGTRLANFLVDSIFLGLVNHTLMTSMGLVLDDSTITLELLESEEIYGVILKQQFIQWAMMILYYALSETFLEGKTAGKYLTKTRALSRDGQQMEFGTALLRSFIRIVPFEAFSFLGQRQNGWHDRWTKTVVIQE